MKKIKICHVVSGLKAGGVESMIYNYCSKLDNNKYEFHILYQHEPSKKNLEEFKEIGFKLKRISSKTKNPIKNYLETYKYFKKNSFDIVHCHMTMTNFIPLIAAKRAKIKKRICHSHESRVMPKNILKKYFIKLMIYLCNKYATLKIACGIEAGKFLYGSEDFIILNNAIDLNKFEFNSCIRNKIRKKLNIKEDEIVIGHIGRFAEVKNHEFVVNLLYNLIKYNHKLKLILIGDGELKEKIKNLVNHKNLDQNVIFTGVVSNVNEFYSVFDIFVLPSFREGLPLVGVEAQIAGLHCFFSKFIDENIIIDKSKAKLLNLNLQDWEKNIKNIKSNKYSRNVDSKAFKFKNFDLREEIKKIEKIYNG